MACSIDRSKGANYVSNTKLLVFTCLGLLGAVPAQAKHGRAKPKSVAVAVAVLSAEAKQHLLNDPFTVVKRVQAIPKSVLSVLLGKSPWGGMADAGQPFQRDDVVRSNLPFRRLIFAAVSPGYCLVYNEYGGYGEGREVSLYLLTTGQAYLVWRGSLTDDSNVLSLAQLQGKIREGKYHSRQL